MPPSSPNSRRRKLRRSINHGKTIPCPWTLSGPPGSTATNWGAVEPPGKKKMRGTPRTHPPTPFLRKARNAAGASTSSSGPTGSWDTNAPALTRWILRTRPVAPSIRKIWDSERRIWTSPSTSAPSWTEERSRSVKSSLGCKKSIVEPSDLNTTT